MRFASLAATYPVHDRWFVAGDRLAAHQRQAVARGVFYLLNPPDWCAVRIGLAGITVFVTAEDARARARANLIGEVVADLHRLVDELGLPEAELAATLRARYRAAG